MSRTSVENVQRIYGVSGLGSRERSYHVYGNGDGTFHVLAVDDGGGAVVADQIVQEDTAELIAHLLNFAAQQCGDSR